MSIRNTAKPTSATLSQSARPVQYETWASITTTWATETRTWTEMASTMTNTTRPTSSITNIAKPA